MQCNGMGCEEWRVENVVEKEKNSSGDLISSSRNIRMEAVNTKHILSFLFFSLSSLFFSLLSSLDLNSFAPYSERNCVPEHIVFSHYSCTSWNWRWTLNSLQLYSFSSSSSLTQMIWVLDFLSFLFSFHSFIQQLIFNSIQVGLKYPDIHSLTLSLAGLLSLRLALLSSNTFKLFIAPKWHPFSYRPTLSYGIHCIPISILDENSSICDPLYPFLCHFHHSFPCIFRFYPGSTFFPRWSIPITRRAIFYLIILEKNESEWEFFSA